MGSLGLGGDLEAPFGERAGWDLYLPRISPHHTNHSRTEPLHRRQRRQFSALRCEEIFIRTHILEGLADRSRLRRAHDRVRPQLIKGFPFGGKKREILNRTRRKGVWRV